MNVRLTYIAINAPVYTTLTFSLVKPIAAALISQSAAC